MYLFIFFPFISRETIFVYLFIHFSGHKHPSPSLFLFRSARSVFLNPVELRESSARARESERERETSFWTMCEDQQEEPRMDLMTRTRRNTIITKGEREQRRRSGGSSHGGRGISSSTAAEENEEEERQEIMDLSGMSLESMPNPTVPLGCISRLDLSNNHLQVSPQYKASFPL